MSSVNKLQTRRCRLRYEGSEQKASCAGYTTNCVLKTTFSLAALAHSTLHQHNHIAPQKQTLQTVQTVQSSVCVWSILLFFFFFFSGTSILECCLLMIHSSVRSSAFVQAEWIPTLMSRLRFYREILSRKFRTAHVAKWSKHSGAVCSRA